MSTHFRILAIETSSQRGSIALLEADRVVAQCELPPGRRTAQSLAPCIGDLTRQQGWTIGGIQLVAVSQGPGSFTGIRVGITTAKTLAYANKAGIVGINTLDCIAQQAPLGVKRLGVVIDAQRSELCVAAYERRDDGELKRVGTWSILKWQEWLDSISQFDSVSGPGLARREGELTNQVAVVPRELWEPSAATVGRLAWSRYQEGSRNDLWTLQPIYFRQSAAEEKLARE